MLKEFGLVGILPDGLDGEEGFAGLQVAAALLLLSLDENLDLVDDRVEAGIADVIGARVSKGVLGQN